MTSLAPISPPPSKYNASSLAPSSTLRFDQSGISNQPFQSTVPATQSILKQSDLLVITGQLRGVDTNSTSGLSSGDFGRISTISVAPSAEHANSDVTKYCIPSSQFVREIAIITGQAQDKAHDYLQDEILPNAPPPPIFSIQILRLADSETRFVLSP